MEIQKNLSSELQKQQPPNILQRIFCFKFSNQFRYEHVEPIYSEGPCWARARIQETFNNEDFYLQIDSHMQFEKNWDTYLIKYIEYHKITKQGALKMKGIFLEILINQKK